MFNSDLVTINNGQPTTTSQAVAEKFGKSHSVVLRALRTAIKNDKDFNPELSSYIDAGGKPRVLYLLTPDESKILESRFTGHERTPYGLKEEVALSTIEQVLGIILQRQYNVGGYRIDGYDAENNVAYEIDEHQHLTRSHRKSDKVRQRYIENEIGCNFVRVKV